MRTLQIYLSEFIKLIIGQHDDDEAMVHPWWRIGLVLAGIIAFFTIMNAVG